MSGTRGRLALAGLLLAGAVEVWLAHRTAAPGGILARRGRLFAEVAGMWGAYAVALWCVRAVPRRTAVVVVLGLAVVLRLASVSHKAPLSDDLALAFNIQTLVGKKNEGETSFGFTLRRAF